MGNRKDIKTRDDIIRLVEGFYKKVESDDLLGPFFAHLNKNSWPRHLSVMYDFWENSLFFTGTYGGNPLDTHRKLNARKPMAEEHFHRWLILFEENVDEQFAGEKANLAKLRAKGMAQVMISKVIHGENQNPRLKDNA